MPRIFLLKVCFLVLAGTKLFASDVKIGLYADTLRSQCYANLASSGGVLNVYVYATSDIPLQAVDFAIDWNEEYFSLIAFSHSCQLSLGDVRSGLSLVFQECKSGPVIPIGKAEFFVKNASARTDVQVLYEKGYYGLSASTCQAGFPVVKARGGRLAVNYYQDCTESYWLSKLKQQEFIDELAKMKATNYSEDDIVRAFYAAIVVIGDVLQIEENREGPFHTFVTVAIDEVLRVNEMWRGQPFIDSMMSNNRVKFGLFGGGGYVLPQEPRFLVGQKVILFFNGSIHKSLVEAYYEDYASFSDDYTIFNSEQAYLVEGPICKNMKLTWKIEDTENLISNIKLVDELFPSFNGVVLPDQLYKEFSLLSDLIVIGNVARVDETEHSTKASLAVEQYLKSKWPDNTPSDIWIYLNVGSQTYISPSPPRFHEGEHAIVFLLSRERAPLDRPAPFPEMFVPFFSDCSKYVIDGQNIAKPDEGLCPALDATEFISEIQKIVGRIR